MSRPGVAAALADPMTQTNRSHSRPPGDERDHGDQAGGDRDHVAQAARSAGMPLDDHPAGARTIDPQAAPSASGDFRRERSLYPGQGCLPAGTASPDEGSFECSPRARRACRPDRRTPAHRTAANGWSRLIPAASSPKRLTWASTQYLTPPWCTATVYGNCRMDAVSSALRQLPREAYFCFQPSWHRLRGRLGASGGVVALGCLGYFSGSSAEIKAPGMPDDSA
jgi:hypothetical protein